MSGDTWQRVTKPGFSEKEGTVVLPKFKLEYSVELNQPLQALGMKKAFDKDTCGFFRHRSGELYIYATRQKAFVEVKEEGTEAAAVTLLAMADSLEAHVSAQSLSDDCGPAFFIFDRGPSDWNDFVHGRHV